MPLTHSKELINIHSAFHAGAFQQVIDFDTSSFSSSNALPVKILQSRSKIALGQAKAVSAEFASEKTPDLVAVKLLADQDQGKDVLAQAKKLADQYGQENLNVQLLVGIVLEKAGETEDALALLSKHQGSLDAYVSQDRGMAIRLTCSIASRLSYKSTSNKTAQTSLLKKRNAHGNGRKTASSSTLPSHGSACEKYVLSVTRSPASPLTISGRRQVPIRILRLRGTRADIAIAIPPLSCRTSRIRAAPRPPPRSRSRATTGIRNQPEVSRHDCESDCAEHAAGQDEGDAGAQDTVG
jgi:hypothetical protein